MVATLVVILAVLIAAFNVYALWILDRLLKRAEAKLGETQRVLDENRAELVRALRQGRGETTRPRSPEPASPAQRPS